jgi:hypothetical protein
MIDRKIAKYWRDERQDIGYKNSTVLDIKTAKCWIEKQQNIGQEDGRTSDMRMLLR